MVYVKRNAEMQIIAISRDPAAVAGDAGWSEAADNAPEIFDFCSTLAHESDPLRRSDLGFVRVLEDVIDLLVERSIIRFTDLPPVAQSKLMERRSARAELHQLSLLDDSDSLI